MLFQHELKCIELYFFAFLKNIIVGMTELTIEQISTAIKSTGFIFEQKAATIIEREGFLVTTNSAYLDEDENKSREIDIVAHREVFALLDYNIRGICYLTCECKDSKNPLVFFTRKKNWGDSYFRPTEIQLLHDIYHKTKDGKTENLDGFYYMQLEQSHFYTKSSIKAVQFCKITRNNSKVEAQTSGLVDSLIYPVIKAYRYNSANAPKSNENIKYCKLFLNLIIVSANLYTVDSENSDAQPIKADFVPFIRDVRTQGVNGVFLTTFVAIEYLEQFIKEQVLDFCNIVFTKYMSNRNYIKGPVNTVWITFYYLHNQVHKLCTLNRRTFSAFQF